MDHTPAASDLHRARPAHACGTGVLVLAGSSGRLDAHRADLLARHGVDALALRWFGGAGPQHPRQVPIESFAAALDLLAPDNDRLAILGLSYGAEAALVTASLDPRIVDVVALAPTDVRWEGYRLDAAAPAVGKWTWQGAPLPFVPLQETTSAEAERSGFVELYRASLRTADPATVAAGRIPVERIEGRVLLVAGADDLVWPSADAARRIAARRKTAGRATGLVIDERAGHQVRFPGEPAGDPRRAYAVGGDDGAAERLGRTAWPSVLEPLGAAQRTPDPETGP